MSEIDATGSLYAASLGCPSATNALNRLIYDPCAYKQALAQSVSPLAFILDPVKYEHCNKCRNELGLLAGPAVSHINADLVDLENDLRGIDRPLTHCPGYQYMPSCDGKLQGKEYIKPVTHPVLDTTPRHLPACQMHSYPSIPYPPAQAPFVCPAASR